MSQVVTQEKLTRLFVVRGIITQEDVLDMVKVVNGEMKRGRGLHLLIVAQQ